MGAVKLIGDFTIQIGTKFVFGANTVRSAGEELANLGFSKVLVHYDGGGFIENSGLLGTVLDSLSKAGVEYVELGGVVPNPRLDLVYRGIEISRHERVDAILAIGGGSAIDSAKAIGIGAVDNGDVWDFFTGARSPKGTLPVASILTCPASGSESSQVAVVNNATDHKKLLVSDPVLRPTLAIMDPMVTTTLPVHQTACGLVDIFCHVCERYFNDDEDYGLLDRMSESVLRSIVVDGPCLIKDPKNYGLRSETMWAATIAQNNSLGMGRKQDWSTHLIANELSARYDVVHGESISVIMPYWMLYVEESNPQRFARFGREVFRLPTETVDVGELAKMSIGATANLFKRLGMPTSIPELHINNLEIEPMLDAIDFSAADGAIGSVMRLRREDCRSIFEMALRGNDWGD